jgi:hypothetical protein
MILRGAILLETLVALAIFTGAGMLTLSVVGNSYSAFDRARLHRLASDLARSKIAELEAGLISVTELASHEIESVGSIGWTDGASDDPPWLIDVDTERTEHRDLTLVIVTVYPPASSEWDEPTGVTLKQLVRLRDRPDESYREDDLVRDLPEAEEDE